MNFPFSLKCDSNQSNDLNGYADNGVSLGLSIHVAGYSDHTSTDDTGAPVYLEQYNGELRVIVYGDINQQDPTHVISLEGAKVSERNDSLCAYETVNNETDKPIQHSIQLIPQQYLKLHTQPANLQSILDINMCDFFDYSDADELPEWEWIEKNCSYDNRDNGESGINDYILNLSNEFDEIPQGFLTELINFANEREIAYILFNQGC
tara:strand:- start:34256 stop:34876 length:621 start_codon:yes stop_codon:yes gene_type:complete